MDNSYAEKIMVIFDSEAGKLFTQLFSQFELSVKHLNRQMDENVFQKTAGKYNDILKQELMQLLRRLLETNHHLHRNSLQIHQALSNKVLDYTSEFSRKIKQL